MACQPTPQPGTLTASWAKQVELHRHAVECYRRAVESYRHAVAAHRRAAASRRRTLELLDGAVGERTGTPPGPVPRLNGAASERRDAAGVRPTRAKGKTERVAPVARRSTAGVWGPLTPREREVARLVAHGLTNREIAAALVLTEGTAANHVRRLRLRLGFGSRARVAAWVAEDARRWCDRASAPPADPIAAALAGGRCIPPPSAVELDGAASLGRRSA